MENAMRDLKTLRPVGLLAVTALTFAMGLAELRAADQAAPCANAAGKAEPATPPDTASGDGTAPGNAGSTGWTGGTGGAHIGTSPQGATEDSKTWQPPTARGLDLAMEAEPKEAC